MNKRRKCRSPHPWKDGDTESLRRLWPDHSAKEIAKHIGCAPSLVRAHAKKEGFAAKSKAYRPTAHRLLLEGKKFCNDCKQTLPLDRFYEWDNGKISASCKECTCAQVRKYRSKNEASVRERDRRRSKTTARKESVRTSEKRRRQENPEKYKEQTYTYRIRSHQKFPEKYTAHNILNAAVRDKKLTKQPCEVCGSTHRIHGHHDDYSKPLDVRWLCAKHHAQRHEELRQLAARSRSPSTLEPSRLSGSEEAYEAV